VANRPLLRRDGVKSPDAGWSLSPAPRGLAFGDVVRAPAAHDAIAWGFLYIVRTISSASGTQELMTQTAAEQRFLEFQRTGDPAAMAAVFDALAPKLLLLAVIIAATQFLLFFNSVADQYI